MKKIFCAFFLLPLITFGQSEQTFSIHGTIGGYPDGTNISFLNSATNQLDSVTVIKNNEFQIDLPHFIEPDFRLLVIDKQQPVIPLLLDNSSVTITGSKDSLQTLVVTGSKAHTEYRKLSESFAPFSDVFARQDFTPENVDAISKVSEQFIADHPGSYVSLLAVSQMFQLSHDGGRAEKALSKIDKSVRETNLGKHLLLQLETERATAIGASIFPFVQNDIDGKPVSITDFKGKYVLIDFWASWCRPCRMENPNIVANYNRFKDKNFTVLGVSLDESKDSWQSAIKMDKLFWTNVSDLKGWQNEVSSRFNITSIPTNILVDPNGIIIAKNVRGPELGAMLEKLLGAD